MFILKKGHQPGVYVPLRALFLVLFAHILITSLKKGFSKIKIDGVYIVFSMYL